MEKDNIISLASYRERKPVICLFEYPMSVFKSEVGKYVFRTLKTASRLHTEILVDLIQGRAMTFAHVLNVPESEDIWPGDAAELFYPELFACRLSGIDHIYDDKTMFAEHKRCETLRLCSEGRLYPLMDYFEYDFYRCSEKGAFPSFLFGDDGDDEVDTLNSELLLTQEYVPPSR
mgnify:CR=1 FL=1